VTVQDGGIQAKNAVTISAAGNVNITGSGVNNSTGTGNVSATTTVGTLIVQSDGIQTTGNVTLSARRLGDGDERRGQRDGYGIGDEQRSGRDGAGWRHSGQERRDYHGGGQRQHHRQRC
jgi:hypothetical protein